MKPRRFALVLAVLGSCSHGDEAPSAAPTRALQAFPAGDLAATAASAMQQRSEQGHRHGLRIDPPGHHFATFLVVGTIEEPAVGMLLDALAAASANHLRGAGAEVEPATAVALTAVPEAVRIAILNRRTTDADRGLARTGQYRVGSRRGWITLLAVREDAATWRIGGAAHEP